MKAITSPRLARRLLVVGLVALSCGIVHSEPVAQTGTRFSVSVDPGARDTSVSGRILLLVSRTQRFQVSENGTPVFGVNVDNLAPGEPVIVDGETMGYPVRSLLDIPDGDYWVQAYLNVYTTFHRSDGHTVSLHMDQGEGQNWGRSPGNLFSEPQRVHFDSESIAAIDIVLDQLIPPIEAPADTPWVKHLRIQSDLLTKFWGQPMHLGATVLLPKGFEDHPDARYPVVYMQGHFSSRAPGGFREGSELYSAWMSEEFPRMILVTIQHANPYYDDSYGINSENLGPYGDAIVNELIPAVEERFRGIGKPFARLLTGGSTGGWISLAMQVWYPDVFGGTWTFFPDQVDFRYYQIVNILEDDNAYFTEHKWTQVPRPGSRRSDGNVTYTMEQENLLEEVVGDRYRSGGQWAIWNAVFAPTAEDGYPVPIWDPLTGKIDRQVAEWARDHYDIRHYLQENWTDVGPVLVDKIRVYCGRMDNYYLEQAVYKLEEYLEQTSEPYYSGSFEYGDRAGHGWNPLGRVNMLREMAAHVSVHAPAGEGPGSWRYR